MATYIITYDLNNETVRPKIVQRIKKYANWAKLSESSYAVKVRKDAEAIFNDLSSFIDDDDQIYIIPLSQPWFGYGPTRVNNWLDKHLPWLS